MGATQCENKTDIKVFELPKRFEEKPLIILNTELDIRALMEKHVHVSLGNGTYGKMSKLGLDKNFEHIIKDEHGQVNGEPRVYAYLDRGEGKNEENTKRPVGLVPYDMLHVLYPYVEEGVHGVKTIKVCIDPVKGHFAEMAWELIKQPGAVTIQEKI